MFNMKEPLWLPRGSVRSIVFLSLVGTAIFGFVTDRITAEVLVPMVSVVLAFYFSKRPNDGAAS